MKCLSYCFKITVIITRLVSGQKKQMSTIMIISQLTKQLYISVFINGWITQTAVLQIIP